MTGSKTTGSNKAKTASTDNLTKSPSVELSESALGQAAGGAVFPSGPTTSLKLDSTLKLDKWVAPDLASTQKG